MKMKLIRLPSPFPSTYPLVRIMPKYYRITDNAFESHMKLIYCLILVCVLSFLSSDRSFSWSGKNCQPFADLGMGANPRT